MTRVTKGKELLVTTPNEVGTLGKVSGAVSAAGANFITLSAWVEKDKGYLRMLTSDNAKARAGLEKAGYKVEEREVLLVNIGNKPGTLAPIAKKIGEAGIEINYCYATAWSDMAVLVLSTKDNDHVFRIISALP